MTLYRVRWQRTDQSWFDDDGVYGGKENARERALDIAYISGNPAVIIDDWDGSVVEIVEAVLDATAADAPGRE